MVFFMCGVGDEKLPVLSEVRMECEPQQAPFKLLVAIKRLLRPWIFCLRRISLTLLLFSKTWMTPRCVITNRRLVPSPACVI